MTAQDNAEYYKERAIESETNIRLMKTERLVLRNRIEKLERIVLSQEKKLEEFYSKDKLSIKKERETKPAWSANIRV